MELQTFLLRQKWDSIMRVKTIFISVLIAADTLLFMILANNSVYIIFSNLLGDVEFSLFNQIGVMFLIFIFVIYIPRLAVDIISFLFRVKKAETTVIFWNYPFVLIKNMKGLFHPIKLVGFLDGYQKAIVFQCIVETRATKSKTHYYLVWLVHELVCMIASTLVVTIFKLDYMLIIAIVIHSFLMLFLSLVSFDDYAGVLYLIKNDQIKEDISNRYFSLDKPYECIEYTGNNVSIFLERLYIELLFKVDSSENASNFLQKLDRLSDGITLNSMMLSMKIEIGISQLQKISGVIGKERGILELLNYHRKIVIDFEKEYAGDPFYSNILAKNREWIQYYESLIPLKELQHEIYIDSFLLNTKPILQKLIEIGIK